MPQHDFTISNSTHSSLRADINDALQALQTRSSGAAEPPVPRQFMEWSDTGAGYLKVRNEANTAWLNKGTLADSIAISRSSNTILLPADNGKVISATGTFTQTFTAIATLGNGWHVYYRNEGSGVITLDPNASEDIDGATTMVLGPLCSVHLMCAGSRFIVVPGSGFLPLGGGFLPRGLDDKARDLISYRDYVTEANAHGASTYKSVYDPGTGKWYYNSRAVRPNYAGTKAMAVWTHEHTVDEAANTFTPSLVMDFTNSGNGVVNAGIELSQTIWPGLFIAASKSGDGSQHCVTGIATLNAVGPGGYNEIAFAAAQVTVNSVLGTGAGVEILFTDSPDGTEGNAKNAKMNGFVSRGARFWNGVRKMHAFIAGSEGLYALDGVIGIDTSGTNDFKYGLDWHAIALQTGVWARLPNNTFIAHQTGGGVTAPVLGLGAGDVMYLAAAVAGGSVVISNSAFSARFVADDHVSGDCLTVFVGGTLKRMHQEAANSAASGRRILSVDN
jgi:hypothetical protein